LRKRLDKKWRNQLSRAEKNNLTIVSGRSKIEFQAFREIYSQMLSRKQFETTVDIDEFARIQESLPEQQRMHVSIAHHQGVPVAGLVASAMGNSAIYLLGATSDEGLNAKGAYLLHWTLIQAMKESGIKSYDLGGIDPEVNPGVYHFKQGFSGVDICQISPLVASNSAMSSGMVKAGLAMQRTLKGARGSLGLARSLRQLVTKN
jgi:lipid II:glycine glycyltransferase (peptidoglycan interpeptide bridge formation enzyme)